MESKAQSGRKRKRITEGDLNVCSELGSTGFGVQNDPLPDELLSGQTVIEPTGASSPEELPVDQGCSDTGHVADEPTSVAEAFWALLERAWYTVW